MTDKPSLPPAYFENMYAGDADPWSFETSLYERAKYDATLAALDGRRYASVLEIGCANGILTERLAAHAERLLAIDVSPTALARATARCKNLDHVDFAEMAFPGTTPIGAGFDLILCSEVAYYWSAADLGAAGRWSAQALNPGGDLLLVHWTGETDYPQTADAAVAGLRRAVEGIVETRLALRTDDYRLDLWRKL